MQIWPAIDLRGGKCVRLRQGDYQQETVFAERPGRRRPPVRRSRAPAICTSSIWKGPARACRSICRACRRFWRRSTSSASWAAAFATSNRCASCWNFGLSRLVIGTSALTDPEWFRAACRQYPGKLVLGIDARDGRAATDGWLNTSEVTAIDLARQFANEPLAAIIYTDIATDGMMPGPTSRPWPRCRPPSTCR